MYTRFKNEREMAFEINKKLFEQNTFKFDRGYISLIDRQKEIIIVRPKNFNPESSTPDDMVVYDLEEGGLMSGDAVPVEDVEMQIEIARNFYNINAIARSFTPYATAFAQVGKAIKPYGLLHAQFFKGAIPCTRELQKDEFDEYYLNTGKLICDTFINGEIDYNKIPAILIRNCGPIVWGRTIEQAENTITALEEICKIAAKCESLGITKTVPEQFYDLYDDDFDEF